MRSSKEAIRSSKGAMQGGAGAVISRACQYPCSIARSMPSHEHSKGTTLPLQPGEKGTVEMQMLPIGIEELPIRATLEAPPRSRTCCMKAVAWRNATASPCACFEEPRRERAALRIVRGGEQQEPGLPKRSTASP